MKYEETLALIKNADSAVIAQAKTNWNNVAKPLYSLGMLEEAIIRIAGAMGKDRFEFEKPMVLVFCADNGVVEEGISQSDHSVTTAVANALIEDNSNVNIMAKTCGAAVTCYDAGMVDDVCISPKEKCHGTKNIAKGPAMTTEECIRAIELGINAVAEHKAKGSNIVAIGEMGIGNTTTSTAIISAVTGASVESITGRGSGLSDEGLNRKINVIKKAIEINQPDINDGVDILSKIGGFDIAAMCGACLGGAALGVPVILDGVISQAAGLVAYIINPAVKDYLIASHVSKESAGRLVLEKLGLNAPIQANMALGEGTGAVALIPLLKMANAVYSGTHSFESINIDQYTDQK